MSDPTSEEIEDGIDPEDWEFDEDFPDDETEETSREHPL